jgi:hypothetical protein
MGNCRRWFRPDQQPERELSGFWRGSSESKKTFKREHQRRQRQYDRRRIADDQAEILLED